MYWRFVHEAMGAGSTLFAAAILGAMASIVAVVLTARRSPRRLRAGQATLFVAGLCNAMGMGSATSARWSVPRLTKGMATQGAEMLTRFAYWEARHMHLFGMLAGALPFVCGTIAVIVGARAQWKMELAPATATPETEVGYRGAGPRVQISKPRAHALRYAGVALVAALIVANAVGASIALPYPNQAEHDPIP